MEKRKDELKFRALVSHDEMREIKLRLSNSTPGPWFVRHLDDQKYMSLECVSTLRDTGKSEAWPNYSPSEIVAATLVQDPPYAEHITENWDFNADFIAHSQEDISILLNELKYFHDVTLSGKGLDISALIPQQDFRAIIERSQRATRGPWHVRHLVDFSLKNFVGISEIPDTPEIRSINPKEIIAATLIQSPNYVQNGSGKHEQDAIFISCARSDISRVHFDVARFRETYKIGI